MFDADHLAGKIVRFGISGAASSLLFTVVATSVTWAFGIEAIMASVVGYLVCIPVNFLLNRHYSFRSRNRVAGDAFRYSVLHLFNIMLTMFIVYAGVNHFRMHYSVAFVVVSLLVPVSSFIILNLWVFRARDLRAQR